MFHEILTSLEVFDPVTRIWLVADMLGLFTVYLVGASMIGTILGKFLVSVVSKLRKKGGK